jgi:hypothetical protein
MDRATAHKRELQIAQNEKSESEEVSYNNIAREPRFGEESGR